MSEYILVGKIVNTHGIKGEVKILSNFQYKDRVFKVGKVLYVGPKKEKIIVNSYRYHKIFDMITFNNICDINDVLPYKGMNVYIKRKDLELKEQEYLYTDLIGMEIKEDEKILGKVVEVVYNNSNILLKCIKEKVFYIPLKGDYIIKVSDYIYTRRVSELIL